MEKIEADDLRDIRLNGDFYRICKWLQKNGFCLKERENKNNGDRT